MGEPRSVTVVTPDYYGGYLDMAINEALAKVRHTNK